MLTHIAIGAGCFFTGVVFGIVIVALCSANSRNNRDDWELKDG